jgi:hypothetical protein
MDVDRSKESVRKKAELEGKYPAIALSAFIGVNQPHVSFMICADYYG